MVETSVTVTGNLIMVTILRSVTVHVHGSEISVGSATPSVAGGEITVNSVVGSNPVVNNEAAVNCEAAVGSKAPGCGDGADSKPVTGSKAVVAVVVDGEATMEAAVANKAPGSGEAADSKSTAGSKG